MWKYLAALMLLLTKGAGSEQNVPSVCQIKIVHRIKPVWMIAIEIINRVGLAYVYAIDVINRVEPAETWHRVVNSCQMKNVRKSYFGNFPKSLMRG